jgi:hypothetical protein
VVAVEEAAKSLEAFGAEVAEEEEMPLAEETWLDVAVADALLPCAVA